MRGTMPGGVTMLVECLVGNRNRAASGVRTAFSRPVPKTGGVNEDSVLAADVGLCEWKELRVAVAAITVVARSLPAVVSTSASARVRPADRAAGHA